MQTIAFGWEGSRGRFFSIECIENYKLIRELTAFGAGLLVFSPDDIRQKAIVRVAGHLQAYRELDGYIK